MTNESQKPEAATHDEQSGLVPALCSAATSELNRRIEYCAPVFLALHAEIAAGHYSNALDHAEPPIRELKLCEHDCRYLVEMRKQPNIPS